MTRKEKALAARSVENVEKSLELLETEIRELRRSVNRDPRVVQNNAKITQQVLAIKTQLAEHKNAIEVSGLPQSYRSVQRSLDKIGSLTEAADKVKKYADDAWWSAFGNTCQLGLLVGGTAVVLSPIVYALFIGPPHLKCFMPAPVPGTIEPCLEGVIKDYFKGSNITTAFLRCAITAAPKAVCEKLGYAFGGGVVYPA